MAETSANQNKDFLEDTEQNVNIEVQCIVKGTKNVNQSTLEKTLRCYVNMALKGELSVYAMVGANLAIYNVNWLLHFVIMI